MTNVPTDPYFSDQWYLNNTNSSQLDLNIVKAWEDYTGDGVTVGILDDGFDRTHPDLDGNYDVNSDRDYVSGTNDFNPIPVLEVDNHGTAVTGIIAAEANGTGTVGVAYNSNIVGLRYIDRSDEGIINRDRRIQALKRFQDFDVVNNSWGRYSSAEGDYSLFFSDDFASLKAEKSAFVAAVEKGRDGLGTAIVFAGGNARQQGDNTNHHNYQNSPYIITVAAIDRDGTVSEYSTPGASILVSAFGGDGDITTTDRQGVAGYNKNPEGNYYSKFDGTSASAPMVSGIIALMLEANPDLGYRDIQEILAYSARKNDPNNTATWSENGAKNWNGGGLHVSHDYGFGLVDAHSAVRLAETWQEQRTFANTKYTNVDIMLDEPRAIPDLNDGGNKATSRVAVETALEIDAVEVVLDIEHEYRGDLRVTLISPEGTESVLIDRPGNGGDSGEDIKFRTASTHFRGEESTGIWTLEVEDKGNLSEGKLVDWDLIISGDKTDIADDTYIYTEEFADYRNSADRKLLEDSSGKDTINTSAIISDVELNLTPGSTSKLAGNSLKIGADTTIENIVAGDGDDTLVGNNVKNIIAGYRGDDVINGGLGSDTLTGGAGDDRLDGYSGAMPTDREYDVLTGGDGADTFVLGRNTADTKTKTYYQRFAYATVTDFDATEGDKLQIFGDRQDYSWNLLKWNGGSSNTAAELKSGSDRIAILEDINDLSLVASDNIFVAV